MFVKTERSEKPKNPEKSKIKVKVYVYDKSIKMLCICLLLFLKATLNCLSFVLTDDRIENYFRCALNE